MIDYQHIREKKKSGHDQLRDKYRNSPFKGSYKGPVLASSFDVTVLMKPLLVSHSEFCDRYGYNGVGISLKFSSANSKNCYG